MWTGTRVMPAAQESATEGFVQISENVLGSQVTEVLSPENAQAATLTSIAGLLPCSLKSVVSVCYRARCLR